MSILCNKLFDKKKLISEDRDNTDLAEVHVGAMHIPSDSLPFGLAGSGTEGGR